MENSDSFCILPWVHLHADTSGKIKSCCNANITFGNLSTHSWEEIWKGEKAEAFREKLISGEKDKRCSNCFNVEASGKKSIRQISNEKYKDYIDAFPEKPIYLDIRFSNICNFKCRTCWHGASSKWFEDAKVLKNTAGKEAIISLEQKSPGFIDDIIELIPDMEEIYFAGGEPFLMKEHFEIINALIKAKNFDIKVRYNTNLSTFKYKESALFDSLKKFSDITFGISVDGIHAKGEYIRKGQNWEDLITNCFRLKNEIPQAKLEIHPTVSVFNILEIGSIHQYFVNEGIIKINDIYLNFLERPDYYNVKILTKEAKSTITLTLEKHIEWIEGKSGDAEQFINLIDYLIKEDWSHKIPFFLNETNKLDKIREESFARSFPELNHLLMRQ